MDADQLPATGTCDLTTIGRRSGLPRRVEIWYVIVEGRIVITGTPGPRGWLANLRAEPRGILHLHDPHRDLEFVADEPTSPDERRALALGAWQVQPWYREQPYSLDEWVESAPMVRVAPVQNDT